MIRSKRRRIFLGPNWTILSHRQVLKGGHKARPYKKARTPSVGAGFRHARDTRRQVCPTVRFRTAPGTSPG